MEKIAKLQEYIHDMSLMFDIVDIDKLETNNDIFTEAVLTLMEGKAAKLTYDQHYGVYLTLYPNGTAYVEDQGQKYKVVRGQLLSGVESQIDDCFNTLDKVRKFLSAVPKGNLENMGGAAAVVKSYLLIADVEGYNDAERQAIWSAYDTKGLAETNALLQKYNLARGIDYPSQISTN